MKDCTSDADRASVKRTFQPAVSALWAAAFIALATVVASPTVQAHPGHGLTDRGALHLFASPYHLASLVCLGAAAWITARFVRQRVARRLLQCAGVGLSVGAMVLSGARF